MKLLTALVLILTLTLPALAEPAENIALDAPFEADLNGDGVSETLTWRYAGDGDGEDCLCLEVTSGAQTADYPTAISHDEAMWLTDMGGPALVVTGHDEDGEGRTLVLRYTADGRIRYTADGRIREVMFRADDREKVAEEYYSPAGYGILVSMSGDEITLEAQADVLGSWRARRGYVLNENDRFVFTDAPWQSAEDPENPESWSFPALTTVRSLEYTADGRIREVMFPTTAIPTPSRRAHSCSSLRPTRRA